MFEQNYLAVIFLGSILIISAVAFYLNVTHPRIDLIGITPTPVPEVIVDLPFVTPQATVTPKLKPTGAIRPDESNPTSSPTTEQFTPPSETTTETDQKTQVKAQIINSNAFCEQPQVTEAKQTVAETEQRFDHYETEYRNCKQTAEEKVEACINNCSSYLDVACTEECSKTYQPQFDACDNSCDNQITNETNNAISNLRAICHVIEGDHPSCQKRWPSY